MQPIRELLPLAEHEEHTSAPVSSVLSLISAVKRHVEPHLHSLLDGIIAKVQEGIINKQQLQPLLCGVVGRQALRNTLLDMFPQLEQLEKRREVGMEVERLAGLADTAAHIAVARYHDLSLLAACCKVGAVDGCRRLLDMGADPNADGALTHTLAIDGMAHTLASSSSSPMHAQEMTRAQVVQGQGQLACAKLLLAFGARMHATPQWGASPLDVAERQWRDGEVLAGSAAALVITAYHGWTRRTHRLFPLPVRARARVLIRLGQLLSVQPTWAAEAQAVVDVWQGHVLPAALSDVLPSTYVAGTSA